MLAQNVEPCDVRHRRVDADAAADRHEQRAVVDLNQRRRLLVDQHRQRDGVEQLEQLHLVGLVPDLDDVRRIDLGRTRVEPVPVVEHGVRVAPQRLRRPEAQAQTLASLETHDRHAHPHVVRVLATADRVHVMGEKTVRIAADRSHHGGAQRAALIQRRRRLRVARAALKEQPPLLSPRLEHRRDATFKRASVRPLQGHRNQDEGQQKRRPVHEPPPA